MSFLTPLFFLGLAALAVPVLIHLTQREKKTVVEFPSLMFLRKIPYESVRRRRIRDWLLLLLRVAALAAIVSAFARPFVRGSDLAAAPGGARDVVVLLDRSYSMGFADTWARAQQAAARALGDVTPSDRVSLVLFSDTAAVAVRSTPDRARAIAEITAASPGPGATKYAPAITLAGSLLAESRLPRREVVLVSDFQRGGWQPDAGLRLPGGVAFTPVPVDPGDGLNLALTPVSVRRLPIDDQERVEVTAGVLNRSTRAVPDLALQLEMDGRVIQTNRVSVESQASASTRFAPVAIRSVNTRFAVRLAGPGGATSSPDALARDNTFYFTLSPAAPVPVMVVGQGSRADTMLYLTRALAIGDAPRFDVSMQAPESIPSDALARARLVILNDVAVDEALATRLMAHVEGGGGLLVTLGARAAWPSGRLSWLPAEPVGLVDRTRGAPAKVGGIDYGHAVFEAFRAPRSGDFAGARFYLYRGLTAAKGASVLARFDTGEPALVSRTAGRGRVMLLASTLDLGASDLPLKPVFLPFMHQLVRYLAGYREPPSWLTVGQVFDVAAAEAAAGVTPSSTPRAVLTPSGQRRDLGAAGGLTGTGSLAFGGGASAGGSSSESSASSAASGPTTSAVELTEQGFYEVRGLGREAGGVIVTAANVDLAESNLERLDPKELSVAMSGAGPTGSAGGADVLPDEAQELAQRVWWYLLFAGILLLIAETVLAQRLSRAGR